MADLFNDSDCAVVNVSTLDDDAFWDSFFYRTTEEIIFKIILPIIITFGLIGNVCFLYVVWRVPRMRTVTNIYLLHLSVADILFLLVGGGEKVLRVFISPVEIDRYLFKQIGCIVIIFVINLSSIASLCLVTLVTVERYYAISRPVKHRLMAGKDRTLKFIAAAWITSFIISSTIIPSHSMFSTFCIVWPDRDSYLDAPPVVGVCDPAQAWWSDYANGVQTVPFFVALVLNFYMYFAIVISLYTHVSPTNSVSPSVTRMRLVVSWMVIINGIVFFGCNALFNLLSITFTVSSFAGNTDLVVQWYHAISPFHVLFLYVNSMVNPFIYGSTNRRLRKAFVASVGCAGYDMTPPANDTKQRETAATTMKKS